MIPGSSQTLTTEIMKATEATRALAGVLNSIFTPEVKEAIRRLEQRIIFSRRRVRTELLAWGLPFSAARWFSKSLPDSVVLKAAKIFNNDCHRVTVNSKPPW